MKTLIQIHKEEQITDIFKRLIGINQSYQLGIIDKVIRNLMIDVELNFLKKAILK